MNTITLYLAGGVFNAAEQVHNLLLEDALMRCGYNVILPQREALMFVVDGALDIKAMAQNCFRHCIDPKNIVVMNLDGADADSGASLECGIAIAMTGRVVAYRTDIRTVPEREAGMNGMFQLGGIVTIHHPSARTSVEDMMVFYTELAEKIHMAVSAIVREGIGQ